MGSTGCLRIRTCRSGPTDAATSISGTTRLRSCITWKEKPGDRWNAALRDQIVSNQAKNGKLSGSWHPSKPQGDDHEYGEAGGRLYVTCLSILTLEVYYRHLPLYSGSRGRRGVTFKASVRRKPEVVSDFLLATLLATDSHRVALGP